MFLSVNICHYDTIVCTHWAGNAHWTEVFGALSVADLPDLVRPCGRPPCDLIRLSVDHAPIVLTDWERCLDIIVRLEDVRLETVLLALADPDHF